MYEKIMHPPSREEIHKQFIASGRSEEEWEQILESLYKLD